jgi:hypothetical protein
MDQENITSKTKIIVIDKVDQTLFRDDDALEEIGVIKQKEYTIFPHDEYHIFVQETSQEHQLQIGSYVLFETNTLDQDDDEDFEPKEEQFVIVPILHHLKKISISCESTYDSPKSLLHNILHLAPNLEDLHYEYQHCPDDILLRTLAKLNPKLKKLSVAEHEGATISPTYFTDEGVLKFLSRIPLEELRLENCSVSGAFFKRIGKFATKLKHLRIHRYSNVIHRAEEEENVYVGGGIMENLNVFSITGTWEHLSDKFTKTLAKCAPNIRVLRGKLVETRGCDLYQLPLSFYTNIIEALDLHKIYIDIEDDNDDSEEDVKAFIKAISMSKNLKKLSVTICYRDVLFTVEELKTLTMSSLKVYSANISPSEEWLEAFQNAFPNLEVIDHEKIDFEAWVFLDNEKYRLYLKEHSSHVSEEEKYILQWMGSKKPIIM